MTAVVGVIIYIYLIIIQYEAVCRIALFNVIGSADENVQDIYLWFLAYGSPNVSLLQANWIIN